jgi:hypothetical protein
VRGHRCNGLMSLAAALPKVTSYSWPSSAAAHSFEHVNAAIQRQGRERRPSPTHHGAYDPSTLTDCPRNGVRRSTAKASQQTVLRPVLKSRSAPTEHRACLSLGQKRRLVEGRSPSGSPADWPGPMEPLPFAQRPSALPRRPDKS